MAILRHEPGEVAPVSGMYRLVGHYGESTDFAEWRNEGEQLPLVTTTADTGPLWYVLTDVANEGAGAA